MLRTGYTTGTIATTATTADTVIVPAERITIKRGVVKLLIVTTVVQFQHLTQIVVKVGDREVFNMTPAEFRIYMQRFMPEKSAAVYPAATAVAWEIPFCAMEFDEGDPRRYLQQLEPGDIQVELTKDATPGAGTVQIGWVYEDAAQPLAYFRVTRRTMNVAASLTLEDRLFKGQGTLKFFILNSTGLTEARIYARLNARDEDAEQLDRIFIGSGTMLVQAQRTEDGSAASNPVCYRMHDDGLPARVKLELTTAAGWAGVANEFVMGHLIPARAAA